MSDLLLPRLVYVEQEKIGDDWVDRTVWHRTERVWAIERCEKHHRERYPHRVVLREISERVIHDPAWFGTKPC